MDSKLYSHAIRLLARRPHSQEELRRKLVKKGSPSAVNEVLGELTERGYLDDADFALMRARSCRVTKGWGNYRISHDLRRLGVDARIIDLTLRQLEKELPETEGLHRVTQSWIRFSGRPENAKQLKKLFDRCSRLGYASEQIRVELKPYFDRVKWDGS